MLKTPQSGENCQQVRTSCHVANQTGERPDALETLCFLFPQTPRGTETLNPLALGILFLETAARCGQSGGIKAGMEPERKEAKVGRG